MPPYEQIINYNIPQAPKPKSKWVVPVDFGAIQCEEIVPFPNCVWNVELPLVGEYVPPNLENMDKVVSKFEQWVVEHGIKIPGKELKGIGGHAQSSVSISAETIPTYPLEGVEVELMNFYSLALWFFDDAVPPFVKGKSPAEINEGFDKFHRIFRLVLTGGYNGPEDIVNDPNYDETIACFRPVFEIFHYAYKTGEERVPGFTEPGKLEGFITGYVDYTQGMKLLLDPNFVSNMNEETYRWLRIPDMALKSYIDYGYASINFRPRAQIRNHSIYKMIRDLMSLALGIVNDMYAIARDIETPTEFNYVKLRAKWDGITLREAMEVTIDVFENQINEIELSMKCLKEEFNNEPEIIKTVEVLKDICNGCITFYISTCRYGRAVAKTPVLRSKSN